MADGPAERAADLPGDASAGDEPTAAAGSAAARRRRPRRARRAATNPRTDDSLDLPTPREAPPAGEDARARWFREQRPPHWD
ncbi:hypothetical protein [Nostocoides sp. Soil756]|uniref:hypothetical protein n=1 Tax=Nostocoides sp. Soil756 TaxID=1736399 RepID=UPI000701747E|nr:hypothetical protein [Tetrasphaera sp. Soil756]KRE61970.1 hypothetical protein ASG78_02480 [Tetrasphaera sp. Soil756]